MIRTIWIRIAALLVLAVLPATILQIKLQEDSLAVVYNFAEQTGMRVTLDLYLQRLREDARTTPEREGEFRAQFTEASLTKRAVEEFFLARSSIVSEIRHQTLIVTILTLGLSLIISLLISRGIVKRVQLLMAEREKSAAKLRDLSFLQNWQIIARTLVHELRAPVTPIKLVASDIERKYQSLDAQAFATYLHEAKNLVAEQVAAIELMINGFTTFGKLPLPSFRVVNLGDFLHEFANIYQDSFGGKVIVKVEDKPDGAINVPLDQKLIRDLLFNLLKNASEANDGETTVTLRFLAEDDMAVILFHNSGRQIPSAIRQQIFDPYVSTKMESDRSNMGLGLTIARKIALDHGGDLRLDEAACPDGACFRLELALGGNGPDKMESWK